MKTLRKLSLPLQGIGITAVLLLLTQSAFAVGTDEDTDINNMAIVNYDVGGVGQELIESDDLAAGGNSTPGAGNGGFTTFEVDRKIDFVLAESGNGNTIVGSGELNAVTTFTLINSGNDHQDFTFTANNLGGDNFEMNPASFEIYVDSNGNGIYDAADTATFVDELIPDGTTAVTIFVLADADLVPLPGAGDLARIQLVATAHDGNDGTTGALGGAAADHRLVADDPAAVQNVFAELGLVNYDNAEEAIDIYEVQTAALNVTKDSSVISDPFSAPGFYKAIPGAVVQYTVTIVNSGSNAADNVSVSDTIQFANVTFNDVVDPYATGDATITVNGVDVIAPGSCQTNDADATDGCMYTPASGALVLGTAGGVSIPAGQTAVFTFQVTIQ